MEAYYYYPHVHRRVILMTGELPDFIRCGRALCGDLAQAERREWWLANGLGGYAAGTVAGVP